MPISRPPLPDFRKPPVGEVVLSLQFNAIAGFQAAHLGLFWSRVRTDYPKTETYPPIDPVVEQFGTRPQPAQGIRFEIVQSGFVPRAWLLNDAGTELIQVQQDRFIRNWRKVQETDEYPRYELLRERFERDFTEFDRFIREEKLPEIVPNQCEVTYINHIDTGDDWRDVGRIDEVFTVWKETAFKEMDLVTETVRFQGRFRFGADQTSTNAAGRLSVEVQPAFRTSDGKPILVMNLTARGAPKGPGLAEVLQFFDAGRAEIVRSFAGFTTKMMHDKWGRCD